MFNRLLVVGLMCVGAVGQMACSTDAEASDSSMSAGVDSAGKDFAPPPTPPTTGQFCGGFGSIRCPEGLVCVDDPKDDCDPNAGGRDCGGICISATAQITKCENRDPKVSYVSDSPSECAAILFRCEEGSTQFFNDCGCGCQPVRNNCDYKDGTRRYVSEDPDQCAVIRFTCDTGEQAFFDSCGCGCETTQ